MKALVLCLALLSGQAFAQDGQDCAPVLQKQFSAIMNAQSGWKLKPTDVSVGSLVKGLFTVTASPKAGQEGSEYLVAIWGENDCRITSMVEAYGEKSVHDIVWKKDH